MIKECFKNVRKNCPLVHNITNYVTVNDVANMILACGGSPIMSDDINEVEEITGICGGLNINIGTLNQQTILAMKQAAKKAKQLHKITLLDPVGVGASKLRTNTALELINSIHFDVIKGNASEINALIMGSQKTRGVDACKEDIPTEDQLDFVIIRMKEYAKQTGSIIVMTGEIDLIANENRCYVVRNGEKEMQSITGTGCQLAGLMSAFLIANSDHLMEAALSAVCLMGHAGEQALLNMQPSDGNATYRNRIIDAVYHMTPDELERGARYEIR
ncbi:MAG: hydroxyethylthiazole kinase [Clostridia bacterium]|nr:hydroxyethylthiazole kinase [Clostridia bacterium]